MKSTEDFKRTIKAYLDKRADEDGLFSLSYAKENKNLNDCITYILNTVQKSGCNGFTDDEIYSMAVHYYDEDSIEIGKQTNCHVVVNHHIELTEEEKQQARKNALERLQNEAYAKLKQPKNANRKTGIPNEPTLFNS
jgi:hypothetical protein